MARVDYCDLCGQPLKEDAMWILYLSPPRDGYKADETYTEYLNRIEKGSKEICPTCKYIFDKMFELRMSRLSELANEIMKIYNLQTKPNPKERKNGKEKK